MHEVDLADELNEAAELFVLAIYARNELILLVVIVEMKLIKFDLAGCDRCIKLQGLASIVRGP